MPPITKNTLFYGDNLDILREHFDAESVDLIYLDPPFNSSRSYNVLFKDESGRESEAQITAFEDTWHWTPATEKTYQELVTWGDVRVSAMMSALRQSIGANQMLAYLVMMAARLVELHRVLKPRWNPSHRPIEGMEEKKRKFWPGRFVAHRPATSPLWARRETLRRLRAGWRVIRR